MCSVINAKYFKLEMAHNCLVSGHLSLYCAVSKLRENLAEVQQNVYVKNFLSQVTSFDFLLRNHGTFLEFDYGFSLSEDFVIEQ